MFYNAKKYLFVKDHRGSILQVVEASTGEVMQKMKYSEFGEVLLDTNPGFQPFGFAGGLYDYETKLVRFGARDYDGSTGRWLSKDPIRFKGKDSNLYGYVHNDPINLKDPTGLQSYNNTSACRQEALNNYWESMNEGTDQKKCEHELRKDERRCDLSELYEETKYLNEIEEILDFDLNDPKVPDEKNDEHLDWNI